LRIDELDSLRATALVLMLVLNFVTDLNHFGIMNTETGDQWWWLARIWNIWRLIFSGAPTGI